MKQKHSIWLFVGGVVILPICVFAIVRWSENLFDKLPVLGEPGHVIGKFEMKNQHGNIITENDWEDKIIVTNFFFTHCPVVCPKMMQQLKRVQSSAGNKIAISSFSVDPERDNVQVLKKYADKQQIGNNWNLFTGSKRDIYLLARKDLLLLATDGDGGPNDFIHSDNLILIDTKKRIRGFYKGTNEKEVNQLIYDINKLNKESK